PVQTFGASGSSGSNSTANFLGPFANAAPAGFSAWEGVFVPPGNSGNSNRGGNGKGNGNKPPKPNSSYDPYGRYANYYAQRTEQDSLRRRRRTAPLATARQAQLATGSYTITGPAAGFLIAAPLAAGSYSISGD